MPKASPGSPTPRTRRGSECVLCTQQTNRRALNPWDSLLGHKPVHSRLLFSTPSPDCSCFVRRFLPNLAAKSGKIPAESMHSPPPVGRRGTGDPPLGLGNKRRHQSWSQSFSRSSKRTPSPQLPDRLKALLQQTAPPSLRVSPTPRPRPHRYLPAVLRTAMLAGAKRCGLVPAFPPPHPPPP